MEVYSRPGLSKFPVAQLIRTLAIATALLLTTACAALDPIRDLLPPDSTAVGLTVMVHGVDGSPDNWPLRLEVQIRRAGFSPDLWDVLRLDWRDISDHVLTSAHRGYRLGREIGRLISARPVPYRFVHLVAHSMGSHVIQGIADACRQAAPETVIRMTFLDPFVMRGLFTPFFGRRTFGTNSDFAECYLTTTGLFFSSNVLLHSAHNFDLTGNVPADRAGDRDYAHVWPIYYYLQSGEASGAVSPYASGTGDMMSGEWLALCRDLTVGYPRGDTTVLQ